MENSFPLLMDPSTVSDEMKKDFWRDVRKYNKEMNTILPEEEEKTKELLDQALNFMAFQPWTHSFVDLFGSNKTVQKQQHPFYGIFVSQLRVRLTTAVPIAAVSFSTNNLNGELLLNPKTCKNLTPFEFGGILVHEVLHILCEHLSEMNSEMFSKNHNICNVAMDASINQILNADHYPLPQGTGIFDWDKDRVFTPVSPGSISEQLKEQSKKRKLPVNAELNKDWLYYYNFIMERIEPNQEMGEGSDHSFWEDFSAMTPEQQEILKRAVAQRANEAYEAAKSDPDYKGIGNGDEYLQKIIASLQSEIPWQFYISRFLGFIGKPRQMMTSIRMNRYNRPGMMITKPSSRIGIVLDTSGSVSDEEYAKFLGEVIELSRNYDTEIIMCECSHAIAQEPYVLEEYKNIQTRTGYGGTCMRPGIDYFLDQYHERGHHHCNGIIVFSDGELGKDSNIKPNECPLPIMWVFTRKTDWEPECGDKVFFKMAKN